MKDYFDIYTLFEIKQNIKAANNFFERFDSDVANPLYTLMDLGKLNKISPSLLALILLRFEKETKNELEHDSSEFEGFTINEILNYVEITHLFYRNERMKRIERIIFNLEKEIGGTNSFTDLLYQSYIEFRQFLFHHLSQEEEILFPYAKSLIELATNIYNDEYTFLKSKLPECFLHTHTKETEFNLFRIFTLVPSQFYQMETTEELMNLEMELKSFKVDLDVHSWIEEEVLIPRIITLRKELFNQ